MRINDISHGRLEILLTTILWVAVLSAAGRANCANSSFKEIYSKSQSEPGEAFYFFIPQPSDDKNIYMYIYDTKLDRLLLFPKDKSPFSQIESQELTDGNWSKILNDFLIDSDSSAQPTSHENGSPLKVIEMDKNWVKFTLNGKHIILPRELMVEAWGKKNFPLGQEIVDKKISLPRDYVPDDLVKIHQKWNFHAPDYPKYLRKYVAYMLEQMLQNAEEQGLHIRVFSAYRSYEKQRYLYLNAVSRYGESQNRVAKPGHSEHQLGTAVDLCTWDPKTVSSPDFDRTEEGRWLSENAARFGFHQSYTRENQHMTGYIPEPWHYRYYGGKRNLD